ncbi:hypothetical protein N7447_001434 [Penicillium robsamsonii]|uniref:uncharacterized protein n=1 Tax=Penicillium robsamsonii TaxID=1792511 RepID=UPI002548A5A0|nr:uncharacterized protein N7447_001434 [Penicillium robsamsonii]KAJ5835408.1 hypothetical protein N7447_001434 [Penicillium robsamsonii]
MQDNVLIGVLLAVAFVTPVFVWFFYLWYRSHITKMHQEGQMFDRRNRDRAQANYEPANASHNPVIGPYFTPRGWVRPKTRGLSHVLHPTQYVHPRQPIIASVPNFDQHFQGPNRAKTHSPQTVNQQLNPLSKRQQRKQRALLNKQRQQEQQQSQIEQGGKQNRKNQRKQKNKSQGQNQQKSPTAQSPKAKGEDEQNNQQGNTERQHDQTSNHHGPSGWVNDRRSWDNQHNTEQNDNNNHWGSNSSNDHGGQRNSVSHSPRRNSRDNQNNNRSPQWDNKNQNDHRNNNHQHGYNFKRQASPDQVSRNEVDYRGGWGQSDDGAQQNSHSRSHHFNEDHHDRIDGWGDDVTKSYCRKSKSYRYASPEGKSGRPSPNRDWGHNDQGERGNSRNRPNPWGQTEEQRGNESRSQDGNMHREKKKKKEKKERWQIELEENEKRCRSRSPAQGSDAEDTRSRASGWKERQKW